MQNMLVQPHILNVLDSNISPENDLAEASKEESISEKPVLILEDL